MNRTLKYYPHRFNVNTVEVTLDWKVEFLQIITRMFGINGQFLLKDVIDLFDSFSEPAIRNKFYRLYNQGLFIRELRLFDVDFGRKNIYVYRFANYWKDYYHLYGGFNIQGPLVDVRKRYLVHN